MKEYKFDKEGGCWYIDLPDWTGSKGALQMVMGADTMLDVLSNGNAHVVLQISLDLPIGDCIHLRRTMKIFGGAFYKCTIDGETSKIWLCSVTKFVFGFFPKHIYISKDIKSYTAILR